MPEFFKDIKNYSAPGEKPKYIKAVEVQKAKEYIDQKTAIKLAHIAIANEMSRKVPELEFLEADPDIAKAFHASEEMDESEAWQPKSRKKPAAHTGRTMIWPYLIKTEKTGSGIKLKLYHVYQNFDKFLARATGLEDREADSIIARIKEVIRSGGASEESLEENM